MWKHRHTLAAEKGLPEDVEAMFPETLIQTCSCTLPSESVLEVFYAGLFWTADLIQESDREPR
jgi:hypothetical protein